MFVANFTDDTTVATVRN